MKVRLVNDAKDCKKYVTRPSFVSQKIFNKNLVTILETKPVVTLDQPIYIGFSIFHLSKLSVYKFHYKYMGAKYNNHTKLLFTDTDKLVNKLKQMMFMKIFIKIKFCLVLLLSKRFRLLKNEAKRKIIKEFVGLNSKMYSLIVASDEKIKKAKGVNKNTVKNIRYKKYVDIFFNRNIMRHKMKRIKSKLHRIETYDVCKINLSCFGDKR